MHGEVPAAKLSPHHAQQEQHKTSALLSYLFGCCIRSTFPFLTLLSDDRLEAKVHMDLLHLSEKGGERPFSGVKCQQEPKLLRELPNMEQFTLEKS